MSVNILLIEDSDLDSELTKRVFNKSGQKFSIDVIENLPELEYKLNNWSYDVVISDYRLASFTGEDVFDLIKENYPDIPFIVLSGSVTNDIEIKLLENDVTDIVLKRNLERLPYAVKRALKEKKNQDHLKEKILIQNTLAEISILFDSNITLDEKINETLKLVGEATHVSRAYMFEDYDNGRKSRNTHEWASESIISQINNIVDLDYENDIPEWKSLINKGHGLKAEDIRNLPDSFKEILIPQDIKSMLVYPVLSGGEQTGFIGISDIRNYRVWPDYYEKMLMTVSGFISTALKEQQFINNLKDANESLKEALEEKNVLIAEIHHRVKNNLALISGFLELETFKGKNPEIISLVKSNLRRIKSIAKIQELLYASGSFNKVPIKPVISELISSFSSDFKDNASFILGKSSEEIVLNINQASPMVLFISELFSELMTNISWEDADDLNKKIETSFQMINDQFVLEIKNELIYKYLLNLNSLHSVSEVVQILAYQLNADVRTKPNTNILYVSFVKEDKKGSASSF